MLGFVASMRKDNGVVFDGVSDRCLRHLSHSINHVHQPDILEAEADLAVVGEAGDGLQALEQVRALQPDVVLMDIRMPRMDGVEATRQITGPGRDGPAKVLVLTTFDLDEYVVEALRAGASGFLLKDAPANELVQAIRVVAAGEGLLAPSVTRRLIAEFASRPEPARVRATELAGVTEREREVLLLIARGLSNSEIAQQMCVSLATVKSHVGRLLAKLDARDRAQLVIIAYESALVAAEGPSLTPDRRHGPGRLPPPGR